MAADASADFPAFTAGGQTLNFGQLYQASLRAAGEFRESGVSYVALLDESSLATPVALFVAAIAGIPYAPINYRLTAEEIDRLLERLAPAYLITDPVTLERLPEGIVSAAVTSGDFLREAIGESAAEDITPDEEADVAVQLFTSGTTGTPKAAILRHDNMMSYILGSVEFMSGLGQTSLTSVPPYHIAGTSAMLSSVYACRHTVLMPSFEPGEWLKCCCEIGVTNTFVVPTMMARILDVLEEQPQWQDLPSLQAIAYGGGKMPREVIERAMAVFPDINFTNAYGLTETSSTIALLGNEDHREAFTSDDDAVRARLSSVGKPLPGIEIEVRGDDGAVVAAGEEGEVYVRGGQVSGQYREKRVVDDEGWFATRDLGRFD